MKKISKVLLSSGIVACMMAGLFASPTNDATKGIFKTEGDKYLDVLEFSEVEFENLFTNIWTNTSNVDAGVAWKVGDLYMAGYYSGRLFNATLKDDITVDTTQTEGSDVNAGTVIVDKTITDKKSLSAGTSTNNFSFLTGIGNLGIRTSFRIYQSKSSNNGTNGDISYEESGNIDAQRTVSRTKYKYNNSDYTPSVEVGLPLSIGDTDLKLKSGLSVRYDQNGSSVTNTKTYTWYNNEMGKNPLTDNTTVTKNQFIRITPSVSAELFDMGASYSGNFYFYNHGFKAADGSKIKTKGYSTATNNTSVTEEATGVVTTQKATSVTYTTKYLNQSNTVNLWYEKSKVMNEKLSLGFNTNTAINFSFANNDSSYKAKNSVTETTYNYDNAVASAKDGNYVTKVVTTSSNPSYGRDKSFNLSVAPAVNLAAQYAITPAVKLNMGFKASGTVYSLGTSKTTKDSDSARTTITTVTTYADGTTTTEKTVPSVTSDTKTETDSVTNTFQNINTSVSAGMSFQVTDNFLLDCGINVGKSGIDDLSKLFNNVSIAGTVKF